MSCNHKWFTVFAEDYCKKVTDGTHDSPKKQLEGKYLITSRHLKEFSLDLNNAYRISESDFNKINERSKVDTWDIMISMIGTVGNIYLEKSHQIDYAIKNVGLFKMGGDVEKAKWLYYYLKSPKAQEYIKVNMRGSTQQYIPLGSLRKLPIKVSAFNKEMNTITHILSTLDEKIETNNQINEKLEEMAQALFKHWFVDFEFPNENGEPYKSSGGEMVESELGMIPKGWEVGKLGELVEISNKSIKPQEYPEKFFEHYSIPAFDNGRTPEIQKGEEIKSSKYVINNHMVLVSKLNPSTKRIWKPITQTNNAICSTEFIVYMAKKENILSYVFEFLNNEKFQGILTANATGSTGSRQRVKPKETLNYKVVLPPFKLMRQFSKIIEPMHLKIGSNMIENQKLKGLRDILLPKLFSGEIRVPLDNETLAEQS